MCGNGPTQLQVETYVGTSGRVFPKGQKAAVLLRAWVQRLRAAELNFAWARGSAVSTSPDSLIANCQPSSNRGSRSQRARSCWRSAAHRGRTQDPMARGQRCSRSTAIEITPWAPANCGWNVDWPPRAARARRRFAAEESHSITAGDETVSGELLITRYGLEGGAIYRHGPSPARNGESANHDRPEAAAFGGGIARTARARSVTTDWPKTLKLSMRQRRCSRRSARG